MRNRTRSISIVVLIVAIVFLGWLLFKDGESVQKQTVAQGSPIDITLDFYEPWLSSVNATDTDPYAEELANDPILSSELRDRLAKAADRIEGDRDPVLCQTEITSGANMSARPIFENENEAQVLVMFMQEGARNQASVTLKGQDGGWYIDAIECTAAESAPEREFSFDREGALLKNVPEPLDSQYWHLVFEQDGQDGHTVPLFFDEESVCEDATGAESVCSPDEFIEASGARVKGQMTESGLEVKQLKILE